jgi:hypothetical protein
LTSSAFLEKDLLTFHKQSANWGISWGWDNPGDFTVMTVVNQPEQYEAFFGFSHPNAGLPVVFYPDNGPNAVQKV